MKKAAYRVAFCFYTLAELVMYKTITKTGLAIAISAAISFPTHAVSDSQKQQLNNAVIKASQSQEEKLKEFHDYVNAYLDEYEQWRDSLACTGC